MKNKLNKISNNNINVISLIYKQTQIIIMKKLLVLTMVLASYVSYGQSVEKQTVYVLKMTEQEYNDYVNKDEKKQNTHSRYNKTTRGSFGVTGGYSSFLGNTSISNFSWGSWIDFGRIGIEYNASVGLNTDDPFGDSYVRGEVGEWISGGFSRNIGVFSKTKSHIYYGGGIQMSELIGVRNTQKGGTGSNGKYYPLIVPEFFNDKNVLPYVTIGYMKRLNELFTFKGGLIISKFSMVNVGVGYSF
jgi:hypothetical protein